MENVLTLLIEALHEHKSYDTEVMIKACDGSFFCGIRFPNQVIYHGSHGKTLDLAARSCAESWLKVTSCKSKWTQLNEAVHGGQL